MMKKDYESTQNEIDKLLRETSQEKNHKKYQDMKTNKNYNYKIKKIGKLLLKLEKLENHKKFNN